MFFYYFLFKQKRIASDYCYLLSSFYILGHCISFQELEYSNRSGKLTIFKENQICVNMWMQTSQNKETIQFR